MIPSFSSGFADDIQGMMSWRGTLGYTESCYTKELKDFDSFCMETFPDANTLTWEIAVGYLTEMRKRRSVRVDVVAIRNLGKYQVRNGKDACIFPNDFFSYNRRRLPYIMSDDELRRFFEAADDYPANAHNPLLSYTVAVIFRLQYSAGMRPQEVRHLTRQDFDFKRGTVYIADSKRHKDRCIAVCPSTMELCRKYDSIARSVYPDTNVFFPNRNQQEHNCASVQRMFHRCWEKAGNPTDIDYCSPYILRHNFATRRITEWAEEGKDFNEYMPYLSAYMGHQTFRETCYYLHLLPERISKMECMDISRIMKEVSNEG